MLQGRAGRGERVPNPRPPSREHEAPPPPGAASCQPDGAQRQLARACPVGLVTGPNARSPCAQRTRAAGPGCTLQGRGPGEGQCSISDSPHRPLRRALAPEPSCRQQSAQTSSQPAPPRIPQARKKRAAGPGSRFQGPKNQGQERQLHATRTGSWGRESAQPWTPLCKAPTGGHLPPPRCTRQRERACAVGLVTRSHTRTPCAH